MTTNKTSRAAFRFQRDCEEVAGRQEYRLVFGQDEIPTLHAILRKFDRMERALCFYKDSQDTNAVGAPLKQSVASDALAFDPLTSPPTTRA